MDWSSPPEPMTWTLPKSIAYGGVTYHTITVRGPCAGDLLKAQAIAGQSNLGFTLRLIAGVSIEGIPYEALAQTGDNGVPQYIIEQISGYFDLFGGAPLPGPLEQWRSEMDAKVKAEHAAPAASTASPEAEPAAA